MLAEESAKLATPSNAPSDEQAAPSGAGSEGSEEAADTSVGPPTHKLLSSFGLHDSGLATNLTEVPLTMSDLSTLYNHFGIRPRKSKSKSQANKPFLQRQPGERARAFKRRRFKEHQRLYHLGPGILVEELVTRSGSADNLFK
ncbi:hypothetical protein MTO96_042619 [Rhipicephalus appendiculatus]